jgi:hypothetical protein
MRHEDLEEKIEQCERLAQWLTDGEMRNALDELAEDYRSRLRQRKARPFMLGGADASGCGSGGSAAGAR